VKLARQESIASPSLHPADARPAKSQSSGRPLAGSQPENRAAGRRRTPCRCGRCPQCLDDARWERIFAEKFADPDYYTPRPLRCSSPLESL